MDDEGNSLNNNQTDSVIVALTRSEEKSATVEETEEGIMPSQEMEDTYSLASIQSARHQNLHHQSHGDGDGYQHQQHTRSGGYYADSVGSQSGDSACGSTSPSVVDSSSSHSHSSQHHTRQRSADGMSSHEEVCGLLFSLFACLLLHAARVCASWLSWKISKCLLLFLQLNFLVFPYTLRKNSFIRNYSLFMVI